LAGLFLATSPASLFPYAELGSIALAVNDLDAAEVGGFEFRVFDPPYQFFVRGDFDCLSAIGLQ